MVTPRPTDCALLTVPNRAIETDVCRGPVPTNDAFRPGLQMFWVKVAGVSDSALLTSTKIWSALLCRQCCRVRHHDPADSQFIALIVTPLTRHERGAFGVNVATSAPAEGSAPLTLEQIPCGRYSGDTGAHQQGSVDASLSGPSAQSRAAQRGRRARVTLNVKPFGSGLGSTPEAT